MDITAIPTVKEQKIMTMEMNQRVKAKKYHDFVKSKLKTYDGVGFDVDSLNPLLKPFQADILKWAIKKGRCAIWADCGMGKTFMQLEFAKKVHEKTNGKILILAPLAVTDQTVREGEKFGIEIKKSKTGEAFNGITITNYEQLHKFDADEFEGVVIDESSILKSFDGKFRTQIIDQFSKTHYKLACTATPAPNDYMELGNHSEFLGIMKVSEMLAKYFINDASNTGDWILKGHAESEFWKFICSWAMVIRKPSDIGHDDSGYILPALSVESHVLGHEETGEATGTLFKMNAATMQEQREARRLSISDRVAKAAEIANSKNDSVLIWCELNDEGDMLEKSIPDAIQVSGKDSDEQKELKLRQFSSGEKRVLITKPKISGFGMNWQHCHSVIFVGVTHSFEQYYQAIRRCWRFGQLSTVECHLISSELEGNVLSNLRRKESENKVMIEKMIENVQIYQDIKKTEQQKDEKKAMIIKKLDYEIHLGDCVETLMKCEDEKFDYSIFSPPFASLYACSNMENDMGNCSNYNEFFTQFKFLVKELMRTLRTGRLISFHCMNLPTSKTKDGYIGMTDFRGDLIRLFQECGFIYHSEVVIWKDPVVAMQRTKALGLLHKQLKKDSAMSRQGIPDYLVTMRKPGENKKPIQNTNESFNVDLWQKYASPIWMDIKQSKTLQKESAREEKDEKHICPLQLEVIERAVKLWSTEGDLVLSPFMGIGSEGYVSLKMGRKFFGTELKESYFKQAALNLESASSQLTLDLL